MDLPWRKKRAGGVPEKSDAPSAEEFTPRAIRRAVFSEAVQHPFTILPAAIGAVATMYMGLMGPDPGAFGIVLGSAVVGAGAWIVNYFFRSEKLAERHVRKLRERRRRHGRDQVERLEQACKEARFRDGEKQARDLDEAFTNLENFLKQKFGKGLGAQRLTVLAEDTYREGISILEQALEVWEALRALDPGKLRHESRGWEREATRRRIEIPEDRYADDPILVGLQTRIDGHSRRVELYEARRERIQQLLAESETLEAALESTYLEVVDLETHDARFSRGDAVSNLERAVAAARRVEERLRRHSQDRDDDEIYREAGKDRS